MKSSKDLHKKARLSLQINIISMPDIEEPTDADDDDVCLLVQQVNSPGSAANVTKQDVTEHKSAKKLQGT